MSIVNARQGDVFIRSYGATPLVAFPQLYSKKGDTAAKRIVLAQGEKTGHAHVLEAEHEVKFLTGADGRLYLRVGEGGARVVHQEHAPVELPAGTYAVTTQHEYDPAEATRAVSD